MVMMKSWKKRSNEPNNKHLDLLQNKPEMVLISPPCLRQILVSNSGQLIILVITLNISICNKLMRTLLLNPGK